MASTTSHPPPATTITHTSKNHSIYSTFTAKNFLTDPVLTYLLNQTPWYHKAAALYHIIRIQLHACGYKKRAIYSSASTRPDHSPTDVEFNPQCAAVTLLPGSGGAFDVSPLGWTSILLHGIHKVFFYAGTKPWNGFFTQFVVPVERAKAATFALGEDYYYIVFISTDVQHRGKGLAATVIGELQARAQEEGKPIWIEASAPNAHRVYLKCGFEDVGVDGVGSAGKGFRMGVGEADDKGDRCRGEGAVGVPVWPMVWWPEGYEKGKGRK
ncbi:hypothetical protein K458DRAFT_431680 [Lentithecium fluviatile CBS 122367]|uniref:N-acetyltransferase domain-containing protein n=1 Tax=Lentithecium fluviatile CBS 122367 TaxID=1168545 RepID=A0A6G1J0M9_9PLEO|nr:hypothetical protein K458DRAFT_431680 [Lentithecium fluviatile CBS 122367]